MIKKSILYIVVIVLILSLVGCDNVFLERMNEVIERATVFPDGYIQIRLTAAEDGFSPTEDENNSMLAILRGRLTSTEFKEKSTVELNDENIFVIKLDRSVNPELQIENFVSEITQTGYLSFQDEDGNVLLDVYHVKTAMLQMSRRSGSNNIEVVLEFTTEGAELFMEATRQNLNKKIGIYLDDTLLTEPTVNAVITDGNAVISGDYDYERANKLVTQIRYGALPFALKIVDYQTISPTLH